MKIFVPLSPDERAALGAMCRQDLRDPRDQMRFILRQEATKRGLLPQEEARHAA